MIRASIPYLTADNVDLSAVLLYSVLVSTMRNITSASYSGKKTRQTGKATRYVAQGEVRSLLLGNKLSGSREIRCAWYRVYF